MLVGVISRLFLNLLENIDWRQLNWKKNRTFLLFERFRSNLAMSIKIGQKFRNKISFWLRFEFTKKKKTKKKLTILFWCFIFDAICIEMPNFKFMTLPPPKKKYKENKIATHGRKWRVTVNTKHARNSKF